MKSWHNKQKVHVEKAILNRYINPGLCKQVPEKHPGDKVARYHQQRRLMKEVQTTSSGSRRQKAQMELDRSYAEESELQHHEASSRVEPARKTKAWTKKHLAQRANIGPEEN